MSEFKVTLARIEAVEEGEQGKQIRAVFHIERDVISFNVPIYLRARDFDNSEMVKAARNSLHRMFVKPGLFNALDAVRSERVSERA